MTTEDTRPTELTQGAKLGLPRLFEIVEIPWDHLNSGRQQNNINI